VVLAGAERRAVERNGWRTVVLTRGIVPPLTGHGTDSAARIEAPKG
jgi:hypothetical protein